MKSTYGSAVVISVLVPFAVACGAGSNGVGEVTGTSSAAVSTSITSTTPCTAIPFTIETAITVTGQPPPVVQPKGGGGDVQIAKVGIRPEITTTYTCEMIVAGAAVPDGGFPTNCTPGTGISIDSTCSYNITSCSEAAPVDAPITVGTWPSFMDRCTAGYAVADGLRKHDTIMLCPLADEPTEDAGSSEGATSFVWGYQPDNGCFGPSTDPSYVFVLVADSSIGKPGPGCTGGCAKF